MVCVGLQQTAQGPGGLSGLTWGDPAAPQKTCPRLNPECETDANLGCALAWSWLGLQRRVGSQLTARGQRRPSPPARPCAWSGPHCPSHLPCDAASDPPEAPAAEAALCLLCRGRVRHAVPRQSPASLPLRAS